MPGGPWNIFCGVHGLISVNCDVDLTCNLAVHTDGLRSTLMAPSKAALLLTSSC